MGKLFSDEEKDLEIGAIVRHNEEPVDIESVKEADDSVSLVTENFNLVASRLDEVNHFSTAYINNEVGSLQYFASLEAYSVTLNTIANNLGVKTRIPAMEDFTNNYTKNAAHDLALESVGEFFKKLWIKLKELVVTFFKKVNEFFRRVTKANLQIDTYEKYIPDLISKIKSNKLTIKDTNVKINSRLPVLLSNPGMETMDDVFLINHGLRRMESMAVLTSGPVVNFLREVASVRIKELKTTLESIKNISFNSPEEDIANQLEVFKDQVSKAVTEVVKGLCPVPTRQEDLSQNAFDNLSNTLVNYRLNDFIIYSLTDAKDSFERLPKNFNLHIAISPEINKIYAVASNEEENTNTEILPAREVEALIRLNDFYNKFKKMNDPRKLNAALKDNEDATVDLLNFMIRNFETSKENMMKSFSTKAPISHDTITSLDDYRMDILTEGHPLNKVLKSKETIDFYNYIERTVKEGDNLNPMEVLSVLKKLSPTKLDEIITILNNRYGKEIAYVSVSPDVKAMVIKTIADVEKYIMSLTQSLQVVYRSLTASLVSILVELRYELARYIYSSAKLYS